MIFCLQIFYNQNIGKMVEVGALLAMNSSFYIFQPDKSTAHYPNPALSLVEPVPMPVSLVVGLFSVSAIT
jgi:hypothetical protein